MGELSTFKAAATAGDQRKKGKVPPPAPSAPSASSSSGGPNLVLHPGKSRSRERKNKLRKKGKSKCRSMASNFNLAPGGLNQPQSSRNLRPKKGCTLYHP